MSDELRLSELRTLRDAIEVALGSGRDYVEMEIRGRRVKKQASVAVLEYLNGQIGKLERVTAQSRGPARNIARVVR